MARHHYASGPVSPLIREQARETVSVRGLSLAQVQRWTLRVGLFALPLAYSPVTYDGWALPKVLLARALLLLLLCLVVVRAVREGKIAFKRTPLDLPLLAFLASAAISTALAINVNVAIFGTYSRYDGLLTLLTYAGLFWLAVQTLEGPADAWALLRTLLVSAYVVAVIAILQVVVDSFNGTLIALQLTDTVQGSIVRAFGTLGQWNLLGEFLALAWPLALWELITARSGAGRLLALNVAVVIAIAMVLTFSRSTWAAAALGAGVVLVASRHLISRRAVALTGAVAVIGIAVALVSGSHFASAIADHVATMLHPEQWDQRLGYWRDSLRLIAASPLVGYGPDTFGLVFPKFQTLYSPLHVDKAHAETLQIAATQGLIGLASYLWMLAAFAVAFWRGRAMPGAAAIFAGWLGYQTILQVNFTAIGSALPYWIFAAAAMHCWGAVSDSREFTIGAAARWALRTAFVPIAAVAAAGIVLPFIADAQLQVAVQADRESNAAAATSAAPEARSLAPRESVYAVEVANVAFERGDWMAARAAYTEAARLGTYNSLVYRNLAYADRNLGLDGEAKAAAIAAYQLDRYDPVNQAVLAQFGVSDA